MQRKRSTLALTAVFAVAFALTTAQAFAHSTSKVIFRLYNKFGYAPSGTLVFDAAGNLYGLAQSGGPFNKGSVFQLTPGTDGKWTGKVIHAFGGHSGDGAQPMGGLVLDSAGNLYGTTFAGGSHGSGTAFELVRGASGWSEIVLHNFGHASDGAQPVAGLIFDKAGNLYGTTYGGGKNKGGTIFQLVPEGKGHWTENVLYAFCPVTGCADGRAPQAGVILDAAGNLYGTTSLGGNSNYGEDGVVFELSSSGGLWTETVLYTFCSTSGCPGGANPMSGLIFDAAGNLYGTTSGETNSGAAFELTPGAGTWTENTVLTFCCSKTGLKPNGPLVFDAAGNLYGTTELGTRYGYGVAFELTPSHGTWTETILHYFGVGSDDGIEPSGGLIFDSAGNLYGVTLSGGGGNSTGTVFETTP